MSNVSEKLCLARTGRAGRPGVIKEWQITSSPRKLEISKIPVLRVGRRGRRRRRRASTLLLQAILNAVGDSEIFLFDNISDALISDIQESARSNKPGGRKSVRQMSASTLKFSNLLQEEELFLTKLKKLKKFNFESDFKVNGVRVSGVKVNYFI